MILRQAMIKNGARSDGALAMTGPALDSPVVAVRGALATLFEATRGDSNR